MAHYPEKYRTNIVAIEGFWRDDLESRHMLQSPPQVGGTYFINFHRDIQLGSQIDLHKKIWIRYDAPIAYQNGYTSVEDIEALRFCYGEMIAISKETTLPEWEHLTAFTIHRMVGLQDILDSFPTVDFPQEWVDIFTHYADQHQFGDMLYPYRQGPFYHFEVHSDQNYAGQECFAVYQQGEPYICLMNSRFPGQDFTYGAKYRAPEVLKELM